MHTNPMETPISNEAIEWFSKLHSNAATPEDIERFDAWRALNPKHAEAYADVERLWAWLEKPAQIVFNREKARDRLPLRTAASTRKPAHTSLFERRLARLSFTGVSLATVLLLCTWLPGALRFWNSDYHTEWGERRELTLDDGSQITLNTHTALSVEFSPQQRVITLLEGEAYFQVTHNRTRPFFVITDHGVTRVTGTAFDVHEQDEQMTVTVSEGHVKVYHSGAEEQVVELSVDLQTTCKTYGDCPVKPIDAQQASTWKSGLLVFKLQPLESVVDELNRYIPGKIMIADPRIRQRIVSGAFNLNNSQDILSALEKNLNLHVLNLSAVLLLYQSGPI